MVRLTKVEKYKAIKWYAKRGYGANEIQRRLKERGLGVRRTRLLEEIRLIREIKITPEKRKKHIPKKYREPKIRLPPPRKIGRIYRVSCIISDVPVHSRPFKRNYIGFRLQAFHFNSKYLRNQISVLKNMVIKITSEYLGYDVTGWDGFDFIIGVEYPTEILIGYPDRLNNRWIFRVETKGTEIYSRDGYL